ncbi:TetR/AcrR family transcriptional regulator [Streptomyces sp. TLI_171]|uniref:TetR/AcrR family transcriptional regulator n=1 Tax=Streptomyces sp. TLI_171 TaxID=1938859 RepID=UPI000C18BFAE|nr:TetR/AcrR family transcriptional regulator [Streptomyces sp. TLI_171]RKE20155.1 TetR family transcriptional regulator [Streptomyces sp. TLI_171]
MQTGTPRERYRAQVREEVKQHARAQIAEAGASALSLNAIAKRMGLSGPALYRYFANRDELITELITDGYRSLAAAVRAEPDADLVDLARTLRAWALADPQRYFLLYGTPVPGYHAPPETTELAGAIMSVLLGAAVRRQRPAPAPDPSVDSLHGHLEQHRDWAGDPAVPTWALHRALVFWTRLHGVLSLELAGHFAGMGLDPEVLYSAEAESLARG